MIYVALFLIGFIIGVGCVFAWGLAASRKLVD